MNITLNTIYRLKNARIGTIQLDGAQTVLQTSDGKTIPLAKDMGKYALESLMCEAKPYYLSDAQILSHLAYRNKRLLGDQLATWDGQNILLPLESDLKGTISYRASFSPRLPTFKLSDYLESL